MEKAVLILDMPSSCSECKLKSRLNCAIDGVTHCCNLAEGMITLDKGFKEKLPNCPLRELPEKRSVMNLNDILVTCHDQNDIINGLLKHLVACGYNACIDELLGVENEKWKL